MRVRGGRKEGVGGEAQGSVGMHGQMYVDNISIVSTTVEARYSFFFQIMFQDLQDPHTSEKLYRSPNSTYSNTSY